MKTKRKNRREAESFSISFLDVASCGFGAMIILLMVVNPGNPSSLERVAVPADMTVADLQQQLFTIRGETAILDRELNAKQEQLSAVKERVARMRRNLEEVEGRHDAAQIVAGQVEDEAGRLAIARQTLTEEMQRLLAGSPGAANEVIAGVPVDSEYIIFVIDTSTSMQTASWNRMLQVIEDTLDIYPEVKGIQVMNDMGDYMFESYRGQWIPDTASRRQRILSTLRLWAPFSNSSPVEGVVQAVNDFYTPQHKISIYVLGDDFQPGGSIRSVLQRISRINVEDANGDRLVRIHAVGFPALFGGLFGSQQSVHRFATLMREMTRQNGGTFVGLNDYQ